MIRPFDDVPLGVAGHFVICFYGAVLRLLRHVHRLSGAEPEAFDSVVERYPFLGEYFGEIRQRLPEEITWAETVPWWRRELEAWEPRCPEHLPLAAMAELPEVGDRGRTAFMSAGLVEEDSRFGTLFAELQQPLPHRRPTLELLGQMASDGGGPEEEDAWTISRALVEGGFLVTSDDEAPRAERALRVPSLLWDAVRGGCGAAPAPWCRLRPASDLPSFEDLVQPDRFIGRLERLPQLLDGGGVQAAVLRSPPGAEAEEVIGAVAGALDCGLAIVDGEILNDREPARLLGALCTLTRSIPLVRYELAPGESAEPPALTGYHGPVGMLLGMEGGLGERASKKAITLTLPEPRAGLRRESWIRALNDKPGEDLDVIAERFHLAGGFIRRAAEIATAHAGLDGRETVRLSDVQKAARTLNRQLLDSLADRLEADGAWSDLVCTDSTTAKLEELELRCRHRERLLDRLGHGFGSSANPGVRALFSGASGTGKTLAARILASELGLDLYRVDLAAVINKYIGETEKNLHRVLSRAEALDVVLLLDEGDALLGRRTEVRSSNDRYANLETNYLLQRLEGYRGIVVTTTNLGDNIDSAFQRRMDVVVPFFRPGARERGRILALHLPSDNLVDPAFLQKLAFACQLTGGQLRNTALHASLLALEEGDRKVTDAHLEEAIRSEYRKAGAAYPLAHTGFADGSDGVEAFRTALGNGRRSGTGH